MSRQTAAKAAPGLNRDPRELPRQMLEPARKSAARTPHIWQKGCAPLAEAADEQAKIFRLLVEAESPVAASVIISEYAQNSV